MPKQSPVPEELDRPFWDACNEDRLVIQNCTACDRLQHPPEPECFACGSAAALEWHELSGRGRIHSYGVVYDNIVALRIPDQPFNLAVIELDEDPEITLVSNLPGIPLDDVPIGAAVTVFFEETASTGQKIPEWQLAE